MMKVLAPFLMIILQGCSFQWLARTQVDTILARQIGGEMNLYRAQELKLRQDIRLTRAEISPALLSLQEKYREIELDKISLEFISQGYDELTALYRESVPAVNAILIDLILSLEPRQRESFLKALEQENNKLQADATKNNVELYQARMRRLVGPLTEKQKELVIQYSESLSSPSQARVQRRLKTHHFLTSLFTQDKDHDQLRSSLHSFFNEVAHLGPSDQDIEMNLKFTYLFLSSLSQDQKKVFERQWGRLFSFFDILILKPSQV